MLEPEAPFVARLGHRRYKRFPCPCVAADFGALDGQEYCLTWTAESSVASGLQYPLHPIPEYEDNYYELEFRVANDFVQEGSEVIDPFEEEILCRCGQALEFNYDWKLDYIFGAARIHRHCPRCGVQFRPQDFTAEVRDGYTGEAKACRGGATYLFAIVIDCGKSFAREGWPMQASGRFLGVVTKALRQPFYQVGNIG